VVGFGLLGLIVKGEAEAGWVKIEESGDLVAGLCVVGRRVAGAAV